LRTRRGRHSDPDKAGRRVRGPLRLVAAGRNPVFPGKIEEPRPSRRRGRFFGVLEFPPIAGPADRWCNWRCRGLGHRGPERDYGITDKSCSNGIQSEALLDDQTIQPIAPYDRHPP
jgi:hypothetical protein